LKGLSGALGVEVEDKRGVPIDEATEDANEADEMGDDIPNPD